MIEITCNDRLGKKVRVKCKYPFYKSNVLVYNGSCIVTFPIVV